jgi:hypothetical protein
MTQPVEADQWREAEPILLKRFSYFRSTRNLAVFTVFRINSQELPGARGFVSAKRDAAAAERDGGRDAIVFSE